MIPIKSLGLRETYFVEPFNEFCDNKTIFSESEGQTLEPSSPSDNKSGVKHKTSFVQYNQITLLTPDISEHNTSPVNAIADNGSNLSAEEENIIIQVPTTEELKRREEDKQQNDKCIVQTESSASLRLSSSSTVNDSEDLPQPTGLIFGLFLLCFPITLGLFLTFSSKAS